MLTNQKNNGISDILSGIAPDQIEKVELLFLEKDSKINEVESALLIKDSKINDLEKQLDWFKEQFKLAQQRHFGRSSEKLALQEELLFNEIVTPETEEEEPPVEMETVQYTRRKTKSCGRKLDTSKLPRERQVHDLTDAEKICMCGCQMQCIGEDISEQIDHIPEQLKVIEHVRLKYACKPCETIKSTDKPESPLPKSMAAAGLIADVMIKKYEHHLPLYRQSKIFAQQGLEIPDNTLGNWVMGGAEALEILGEAQWSQIPKIHNLQADETPVKVLKPEKKGFMWVYHSLEPGNQFIQFEFNLTRAAEHPNRRLKDYKGYLQTDGYSGYNDQRNKVGVINVGCWDHARRKFVEVIKISAHNQTGKAREITNEIGKLYQVESEAKGKSAEERKALRQTLSKPILESIHSKLQNIHAPPQSALGKAVQYTLNQWTYLTRYVDYGEVEISNCWVENQIRPFAIGRRNWLFVGNEVSANRSALLYSLIQTCRLNNIDARQYLKYMLNQVHKMRRGEIDPVTLLPQFIDKTLFS